MSGLRLLRIEDDGTLQFEEFATENVPPYAILSHRWVDNQEVSFEEWRDGKGTSKSGYAKIMNFAAMARRHDLRYCWVDTCCKLSRLWS